MHKNKKVLEAYFGHYASLDVVSQKSIKLVNFIQMGLDAKFIPGLVTSLETAKIFRLNLPSDCLNDKICYKEYQESIACIGIYGFYKERITNECEALEKMFQLMQERSINLTKSRA